MGEGWIPVKRRPHSSPCIKDKTTSLLQGQSHCIGRRGLLRGRVELNLRRLLDGGRDGMLVLLGAGGSGAWLLMKRKV